MNDLTHNIKEYIQANINLLKIEISDDVGGLLSRIILLIFGLFASLVLLLLLLVVVEIGMATLLESHFYGALATFGMFVVLFGFISIFFKNKLKTIITDKIYDDLIEKMNTKIENDNDK